MLIADDRFSERADTIPATESVVRVIHAMHSKLEKPFALSSMARLAYLSRFHFNRTFRRITGIPPTQFLYALRIARARWLLLNTRMKVIDICYEVGYNSLGTFTRRFTELSGVPPTRLRSMAQAFDTKLINQDVPLQTYEAGAPRKWMSGNVGAPSDFRGVILIGMFASAIPQGMPKACAMLSAPGDFCIMDPPDGLYHLFALGLEYGDPVKNFDCESVLRSGGQRISISDGMAQGITNLHLRKSVATDPPILVAIPLLLNRLAGEAL